MVLKIGLLPVLSFLIPFPRKETLDMSNMPRLKEPSCQGEGTRGGKASLVWAFYDSVMLPSHEINTDLKCERVIVSGYGKMGFIF